MGTQMKKEVWGVPYSEFKRYKEMNKEKKIILASNSPRRKEILKKAGIIFDVYVSKGEEYNIVGKKYTKELVNECAKRKAENAYKEIEIIVNERKENERKENQGETGEINEYKKREAKGQSNMEDILIVACDTVVVNNNIIIGKPKNKEEAYDILKSLSGKRHIVSSSICIKTDVESFVDNEETKIWFRELSDDDINNYIEKHHPLDKAGSYGIQDEGFDFVIKVEGNIDNVIGFPMQLFKKLISYENIKL